MTTTATTATTATNTITPITPRMTNPASVLPESLKPIQDLLKLTHSVGLDPKLVDLVGLRASQINGCSFCVGAHVERGKEAGDTDQRLHAVAAWREAPYFTDAERAALALAECVTRLADRSDPVPDEIWDDAADHFTERELGALILEIGMVNIFNRINVTTRQLAGTQSW